MELKYYTIRTSLLSIPPHVAIPIKATLSALIASLIASPTSFETPTFKPLVVTHAFAAFAAFISPDLKSFFQVDGIFSFFAPPTTLNEKALTITL